MRARVQGIRLTGSSAARAIVRVRRGSSTPSGTSALSAGVHCLRTLDDADAIARRLAHESRIVIIGGGFSGLEVAASARARACTVTVIEGGARLLGRAVPAAIAARAHELHARNGVQVLLNTMPRGFERRADGPLAVMLGTGDVLEADTVIVGIGIEPADELARAAGLDVGRGIIVDEALQTSAPGAYAASDVVVFPSRFGSHRIRQERWHNAETQARATELHAPMTIFVGRLQRDVPIDAIGALRAV